MEETGGGTPVRAVMHGVPNHHVVRGMIHVCHALHLEAQLPRALVEVSEWAAWLGPLDMPTTAKHHPLHAQPRIPFKRTQNPLQIW
jgi:hypothetical protein